MLSRNKNKITVLENVILLNSCNLSYDNVKSKFNIPNPRKHKIEITDEQLKKVDINDIISFTVKSSTEATNNLNENNILDVDICDNKIYCIEKIEDKTLTLISYSEDYETLYNYAEEYNTIVEDANKILIPSTNISIDKLFIG